MDLINWYKLFKQAQIWSVESDGSFVEEMRRLYELEYKYQMLKNKPFTGHPKRRENILANIEEEVWESLENVTRVLSEVFLDWLNNHALTDPGLWAKQRMGESYYSFDELWDYAISEYQNYLNPNMEYHGYRANVPVDCSTILKNISNVPSIVEYMNVIKQQELDDIEANAVYEEFDILEEKQKWIEDKVQYINEITFNDHISELYGTDCDSVQEALRNILENGYLDEDEIIFEIYASVIFPLWFAHWQPQGIEETRSTIEEIYKNLENIQDMDLGNAIATVNIAINAAHQNGAMTYYIEQHDEAIDWDKNLVEEFNRLSNMNHEDIGSWNEQLKQIGVQT